MNLLLDPEAAAPREPMPITLLLAAAALTLVVLLAAGMKPSAPVGSPSNASAPRPATGADSTLFDQVQLSIVNGA